MRVVISYDNEAGSATGSIQVSIYSLEAGAPDDYAIIVCRFALWGNLKLWVGRISKNSSCPHRSVKGCRSIASVDEQTVLMCDCWQALTQVFFYEPYGFNG